MNINTWNKLILESTVCFSIGQVSPDDTKYNIYEMMGYKMNYLMQTAYIHRQCTPPVETLNIWVHTTFQGFINISPTCN